MFLKAFVMLWLVLEALFMEYLRLYGTPPYHIALIHGGPGAPGEMAPVARELSNIGGILEPLQTEDSIAGQVQELRQILQEHGALPVILAGHSWGAWLGYILAANYPELVKKLILIASGPFTDEYVPLMNQNRANRLTASENLQVQAWLESLNDPRMDAEAKTEIFRNFGRLMSRVDSFQPLSSTPESGEVQPKIFEKVMTEAQTMRKSGALINLATKIRCPVVAIHGAYDPHPFQGVWRPLSNLIDDFRYILLPHCGHTPWNEFHAKDRFYEILRTELKSN